VWVTVIESVDQALTSMRRLFADVLGVGEPDWLATAAAEWARPPEPAGARVAVPVWRDPWMVIGARTFSGDVLDRLGLVNVYADSPHRYPHVDLEELREAAVDLVLLPDEPYRFSADDGPEALPDTRTVLVSGRALTWYGPSLTTARDVLLRQVAGAPGR
jgi:ABC-type Fe3+-hydroxamate transport system substrate-binding protein